MRSFTLIVVSTFAAQAHAWTPPLNVPKPVPQFAPVVAESRPLLRNMQSQSQQFGPVLNAPPAQIEYVYSATPKSSSLKNLVRPKGATRDLGSKASLKEGRIPGADSTTEREEQEYTYGRYGVEGKAISARKGYTGGVIYGPKNAIVRRSAMRAPVEEAFEESNDIVTVSAVALISFFVGSGLTLAVHRLTRSTATQEPLLTSLL